MAHDSYIKDFRSLANYGIQLRTDSKNLLDVYTDIKNKVARISAEWDDEQQVWLKERIEADQKATNELAELIDRFGQAILEYSDNMMESANRFRR